MKTIATIATSLFAFFLSSVSMPVQAEWKPYTGKMAKEFVRGQRAIYYRYTYGLDAVHLIIPCKEWKRFNYVRGYLDTGISGYDFVGVDYIQVSFDDENPFKLKINRHPFFSTIEITDFRDSIIYTMRQLDSNYFLSRMKTHENLSIRISRPLHSDFIARINLSGFTKIYDSHCNVF